MPTLTVDNFKIGIDTRRGKNVSDANRLRRAINAVITNGGAIQKRGGLEYMYRANSGSVGLSSSGQNLSVFSESSSPVATHSKTNAETVVLRPDRITGSSYAFSTAYTIFDLAVFDEISDDIRIRAVLEGTSQAAIPDWSASDASIVEGSRRRATAATGYENIIFVAENAGTTDSTEPDWDISLVDKAAPLSTGTAATTSDNGITWRAVKLFNDGIGEITNDNDMQWEAEWRTPVVPFGSLTKIWFADLINGNHVVTAEDDQGESRLFYVNNRVADNPSSASLIFSPVTINGNTFGADEFNIVTVSPLILTGSAHGDVEIDSMYWASVFGRLFIQFGDAIFPPVSCFFDVEIISPAEGTSNIARGDFLVNSSPPLVQYSAIVDRVFGVNDSSEDVSIEFVYDTASTIYPNEVTDLNCPFNAQSRTPSDIVISSNATRKVADRIFIANGEEIAFSALEAPDDWSDTDISVGAGFLSAGRQAGGSGSVLSLGDYQGKLIAGFEDRSQSWITDQDASLNAFDQSIDAVGSRFPRSYANVSGDTFFLSSNGIRSISLLSLTNSLADVDVGTAIDSLLRELISSSSDAFTPVAIYNPQEGQYQVYVDNKAYVYTFSRTAKISAWSEFQFPNAIEYAVRHKGEAFLRDEFRGIYYFSDDNFTDTVIDTDGIESEEAIDVDIVMAYLDFKKPAVLKQIMAFDIVCEGTFDVSFLYEYYDDDGNLVEGETEPQTVSSNTRPGELFPVDICVTAIAPRFQSNANTQSLRIDAVNFHYELLGAMQ